MIGIYKFTMMRVTLRQLWHDVGGDKELPECHSNFAADARSLGHSIDEDAGSMRCMAALRDHRNFVAPFLLLAHFRLQEAMCDQGKRVDPPMLMTQMSLTLRSGDVGAGAAVVDYSSTLWMINKTIEINFVHF